MAALHEDVTADEEDVVRRASTRLILAIDVGERPARWRRVRCKFAPEWFGAKARPRPQRHLQSPPKLPPSPPSQLLKRKMVDVQR
jgi:hypothetical protein